MILTGRLTGDATVHTVRDERQVVNFSIAINDRFRTQGEPREVTTYVDCAYWLSSKIAHRLKKGTLVELFGRIGVNAYVSKQGEAVGRLTYHTKDIKFLAMPAKPLETAPGAATAQPAETGGQPKEEDLPF